MQGNQELGTQPVGRLLLKYSIPGVVAMLVSAIYNVLDRVFIGKFAGEDSLAGLTVAFPVMMLTFAFAGLIGVGGSALIAIRFGERNQRGAERVFGNTVSMTFGLGILVAVLTIVCRSPIRRMVGAEGSSLAPILRMFGAEESILAPARDFLFIILLALPFQYLTFTLSAIVRTEGKPKLSMAAMITSVLVNLVLATVLVAWLRLGVRGAAAATAIGQVCGLLVLMPHYLGGKSLLKPHRADWIPDLRLLGSICAIGSSSFLGQLGVAVSAGILTNSLITHGGAAAVTAMGAINSLFTLFIMPIFGIQQGLGPIVGYNHGAGKPERAQRTLYLATGAAVAVASVVFLLLEIFPSAFMSLFIAPDSTTMPVAVKGLRIYVMTLPIVGINLMGSAFFQSVAKARVAIFLGMSRQFVFLIPAVLLLSGLFGLTGTWLATPVADALSVVFTVYFLLRHFRQTKAAVVAVAE